MITRETYHVLQPRVRTDLPHERAGRVHPPLEVGAGEPLVVAADHLGGDSIALKRARKFRPFFGPFVGCTFCPIE